MAAMRVSVCIAATRAESIGAAVRSVVAQSHHDWELIVVAQGPATDAIARAVREALGRGEGRVVGDRGRGASRARNVAVAASTGDLIAMIDDDCEAAPHWLESIVARVEGDPAVGLVAGTVVAPPKDRRGFGNCPSCFPEDVRYEPASAGHRRPDGFDCIGANFAFTRAAADVIGPFDEYLGPGARFPVAEDTDFQWRAVEHGIVMQGAPEAVVHHTHGWRYGLRALWRHQHAYARGNGGYAGKLTLLGEPWGARVLREHRRMVTRDWWEQRNAAALPIAARRYILYAAAYRECLSSFTVDSRALLREKVAQPASGIDGGGEDAYTMTGAESPQVHQPRRSTPASSARR
jgi:glycosyltransferase involved in cell wall biosynthesis